MLQNSKILQGRNTWKIKAIERGNEIREYRKIKKRHLETIAQLKVQNRELKQMTKVKKNS